jgi:DNA-binding CsgD family transcriptional regulator
MSGPQMSTPRRFTNKKTREALAAKQLQSFKNRITTTPKQEAEIVRLAQQLSERQTARRLKISREVVRRVLRDRGLTDV